MSRLLPFYGVIGLIIFWYIGVWVEIVDPVLLPSPDKAAMAIWSGMLEGGLLHDFLRTVERTSYSILIASVIAIPLGIFLGSSENLYRSVEFVIDFFRSTPASAIFRDPA